LIPNILLIGKSIIKNRIKTYVYSNILILFYQNPYGLFFFTSLYELDRIINKKKSNLFKRDIYCSNKRKPVPLSNYLYLVYGYILKTRVRLVPAISAVRSQNRSRIRWKELTYSPLYKINAEKLETTKQYLLENLNKSFIKANQAPFATPVFFVKKPNRNL
jgi:hypothetical protein